MTKPLYLFPLTSITCIYHTPSEQHTILPGTTVAQALGRGYRRDDIGLKRATLRDIQKRFLTGDGDLS
jgi:hypothetical protein